MKKLLTVLLLLTTLVQGEVLTKALWDEVRAEEDFAKAKAREISQLMFFCSSNIEKIKVQQEVALKERATKVALELEKSVQLWENRLSNYEVQRRQVLVGTLRGLKRELASKSLAFRIQVRNNSYLLETYNYDAWFLKGKTNLRVNNKYTMMDGYYTATETSFSFRYKGKMCSIIQSGSTYTYKSGTSTYKATRIR